jgi:hypothetical protein
LNAEAANRSRQSSTTADWGEEFAPDTYYHFDCESETSEDNVDVDVCYDYGDLEETGGSYKVQLDDGTEITLEEHEKSCGCGCGCLEEWHQSDSTSESDGELSELELSESGYSDEDVL